MAAAGWSSLVARRAHNPKVVGSNPAPATRFMHEASTVKTAGAFCCVGYFIRAFLSAAFSLKRATKAQHARSRTSTKELRLCLSPSKKAAHGDLCKTADYASATCGIHEAHHLNVVVMGELMALWLALQARPHRVEQRLIVLGITAQQSAQINRVLMP